MLFFIERAGDRPIQFFVENRMCPALCFFFSLRFPQGHADPIPTALKRLFQKIGFLSKSALFFENL